VEIARRLSLSVPQVSRIRRRFFESGVAGLGKQPKPGRGNKVPEAKVRQVVETVMNPPPAGHSHSSTRVLARRVGLGPTVVYKIFRAKDLKPRFSRTLKVSRDPQVAEKVRDIVGLYLNPPEKAVVISMDEKTQVHALERTQPMLLSPDSHGP
jgi:transposase